MPKQKAREHEKNWNTSLEPDLQIDFMRIADLNEVVAIEKVSFHSPWPKSYFVQELQQNPSCVAIVLREKSRVAGFAVAWILDPMFHINNIAVKPQRRRKGYGRILMNTMIALARQNHCDRVHLEVRVSNEAAIQLYGSLGFQVLQRLSKYYQDTLEDALVLGRQV